MVWSLLGGLLAAAGAAVVLRPLLRPPASGRAATLAAAAALGLAVALVGPTLVLEARETARFQRLGLTEAGVPRNQEPPFDEAFVADARAAVAGGRRWAVITPAGRCADDRAYQWLAFRLHPAPPRCEDPDVELHHGVPPPEGADVRVRTDRYAITG